MNILINETFVPNELTGILRLKSFCELRTGIFNLLERMCHKYPNAQFFYIHNNPLFINSFLERNAEIKLYFGEKVDLEIFPDEHFFPWNILRNLGSQIEEDFRILENTDRKNYLNKITKGIDIVGDRNKLFIHQKASVLPGVIFDLTSGPVIIDKEASILPHTYLAGPLYIGEGGQVSSGHVSEGGIIGKNSKISGQIKKSVFGDFSNKVHDGSIVNSFICDWVNIAGLSSTSNESHFNKTLKINISEENDYCEIDYPNFGAILSDFTRVSGAVIMQPGTYVDMGSVLWTDTVEGYYPAFTYLNRNSKYNYEQFIDNASKQLERRGKVFSVKQLSLLKDNYLQIKEQPIEQFN